MNIDKKLLVGVAIGFFIGFFVHAMMGGNENRFTLKDSGVQGLVYKVDTKTGKTWTVFGGKESPVNDSSGVKSE